ncbi:site-specific DNA-methyltransferase [Brachyspira aalborgi]|uniref:Site-specific DNA-methyltransferase n=2 Tax=Brachyspira TaxID=29521 RepID=A0A5C8CH75_9SPIR|nr:site-specific DNA-methyltransferase [Brachyspira aalborgi]TXJ11751.1 site-specific DNA-methyltransferase [Brachyspira aalborgi]
MDYKKAFYSKLEDCYLGAKIKQANKDKSANKSGFTNLLDIKEKYFNYVKNYLEQRIDFQNSEDASEIYNKLFTFFDSYLNETGTPFFIDTPIYKNIYAKIYSNSKDTNLFYKTQNLYYVKSDIIFESLTLSDSKGKYNFYFDASEFKQNSDNNKSKTFFKLHSIGFDENDIKQITIKVSNQKDLFPKLSNIFKQNSNEFNEEFLKALDNNKIKINEEELKKIFRSYRKQNEIDFFIHKNAKAFLEEQFDLWMFNHLYKDSQIQQWNPNAIKRMQEVRNIAYEIIYFIAKFEDELKAIWLKPKFAKNTEYVFSLDIIINKAKDSKKLLDLIFKDKNFKNQIKEWKELNLIDENFNISSLQSKTEEIEKYKFIPIDTKHLSREVKFELLSSFDNLEELLNGELIKSDNFQALNTIMPKYQGKIDLIYIDPPFNTGSDFEYKDKFQDSTWLSLMENRLELAKNLLSDKGSFYLHLDHNANYRGRELLNSIFGEENFRNEIVWHYGTYVGQTSKNFPRKHDNIMFYSKNEQSIFFMQRDNLLENDANYKRWKKYFNKNNQIVGNNYPKDDSKFDGYVNRFINENGREPIDEKDILLDIDGKLVDTVWEIQSINPMSLERLQGEITQKPEALLQRIIKASSDENSIILDFFAGSGTTCAVALKLGRKFLGVEMGEHFYKVALPRLKKVLAGFASGISKECEFKGGGAFRYYELESYEEALANCEYVLKIGNDKKINSIPYNINDYYNENIDFYEGIIDYRKSRKLIKKLNKAEDKPITINMSAEYREEFDIFQTIANLMNLKIKRLFLDKNGVESCEYDNGEILNIENVDLYKYPKLKSLIWWRE